MPTLKSILTFLIVLFPPLLLGAASGLQLEVDRDAARFVMERTGSTAVPVFQVGTKILQGFSPEALKAALRDQLGLNVL